MKHLLLFFFLIFVLLQLQVFPGHSLVNQMSEDQSDQLVSIDKKHYHHHTKINCGYACSRRCRESSRKNVCHRACRSCCTRCQCVPPGTYGNTHACPCYAGLRTHGNRPKCP